MICQFFFIILVLLSHGSIRDKMTSFDSPDRCDFADKPSSSAYIALFMITGFALIAIPYAIRCAELNNQLNYDARSTRIIVGFLKFIINMLHTKSSDFHINPDARLITAGPHRTGWEAGVIASKMKGPPPQFLATNKYNTIPGVASFMKQFKAIIIDSKKYLMFNG